jgi:ornithine cyclodeaminase/alanine dehydrogenase-like protein (mu-crystallin family)
MVGAGYVSSHHIRALRSLEHIEIVALADADRERAQAVAYGPRDHFDIIRSHALSALIRKVVDAMSAGVGKAEVWGTRKPICEWMYVEDAAQCFSCSAL